MNKLPTGWEFLNIEDIAEVKGGKRLPKGYFLQEEPNSYPYITVSDMKIGGVSTENIKYVPEEIADKIKNYRISKDDLFISVAGTLGIVGKVPNELDNANLTENADKITNIKINREYLYQVLISDIVQKEIEKEKTTNAQPKLALTRIKKFCIPVPTNEKEQRKIALVLSTWDKAIELKEKLIEQKKEQKKGLMQKLLTGEVRLPGFKDKWKNVRIKDLSTVVTGTTPTTKNKEYYNDGIFPWITPTDINESKYISESERYLTKKGLENGRYVPAGSLLVTCIASIGKNAILTKDGSCNQQINAILPSENHSNEFLYYKLEQDIQRMEILAGKSATSIINKNTFEKFEITIPELEEQIAIAEILSKIEVSIELLNKELKQLKLQKKGLMQLLLTGKVRVQV